MRKLSLTKTDIALTANDHTTMLNQPIEMCAEWSVKMADALILELEKEYSTTTTTGQGES